jgi:hypothetical protein
MSDFAYETDLHEACVAMAKAIGCRPMTNVVVLHRGRPTGLGTGSPDLVIAVPGCGRPARTEILFFELKTETGRRSAEQIKWTRGREAVRHPRVHDSQCQRDGGDHHRDPIRTRGVRRDDVGIHR